MSKLDHLFTRWRTAVERERFAPRPLTSEEVTRVSFVSRERRGQATYPPLLILRACRAIEAERLKV